MFRLLPSRLSAVLTVALVALTFFSCVQTSSAANKTKPSSNVTVQNTARSQGSPIMVRYGPLAYYFDISNLRLENQQVRDPLGRISVVPVLAFTVQAKQSFYTATFFAHFYDADGVEIGLFSPVEFNPNYSVYMWTPGMRSRATVNLDGVDMSQLHTISFSQL